MYTGEPFVVDGAIFKGDPSKEHHFIMISTISKSKGTGGLLAEI